MKSIYVIGSLRNPAIAAVANEIESIGIEAFDSWSAPGPEADDYWKKYEESRGRNYAAALRHHAARHVFEFDKSHLERCNAAVLVMPAGKSGHLELGFMLGRGKPGYVLFDEQPERWDVMYQFATGIFFTVAEFVDHLRSTIR